MFKELVDKIYIEYDKKTYKKEDDVVFSFLNGLDVKNKIDYLEVGSGLCRFPLIIKDKYRNLSIKCLEKNKDLVDFGVGKGLDVVYGDVTKISFDDQKFDVVHCSHVIEHLDYKSVTESLDEMLRILKPNGYLIIRSPLMYPGFYFDIDHIRPYPPESILSYFSNRQQQKKGKYKVEEVVRWYRKEAVLIYNSRNTMFKILNLALKFSWLFFNYPKAKPNGYVMIMKRSD